VLVVVCLSLTLVVTSILALLATPRYASTTRLFISTPQNRSAAAYQGGLFSEQRVASYADLITGQSLAQRVVNKLKLSESAAELSGEITTSVVPNTVILAITVTDTSPARSQLLSQTVANQFIQLVAQLETPPGSHVAPIRATVVDAADLPSIPVSPRPLRNLAFASLFGLLLGFGVAAIRDSLDTAVRSEAEVAALTGATVLGDSRTGSKRRSGALVTDAKAPASLPEAYRTLRTHVRFVDVGVPARVVVVTSAKPSEGKTITAINLALTFAQADKRVLLVEADLRWPGVSAILELDSSVGLRDVLAGQTEVEDAFTTIIVDGVHLEVLPSGALPSNPSELLESVAMQEVLKALRASYDVIVLDSPPLLRVTDAAVLAAQADGALLVVRMGKTTREEVQSATQRLTAVGARLLGTVLN
jgi:capsular exopolysaccharide synthesis family protein